MARLEASPCRGGGIESRLDGVSPYRGGSGSKKGWEEAPLPGPLLHRMEEREKTRTAAGL